METGTPSDLKTWLSGIGLGSHAERFETKTKKQPAVGSRRLRV